MIPWLSCYTKITPYYILHIIYYIVSTYKWKNQTFTFKHHQRNIIFHIMTYHYNKHGEEFYYIIMCIKKKIKKTTCTQTSVDERAAAGLYYALQEVLYNNIIKDHCNNIIISYRVYGKRHHSTCTIYYILWTDHYNMTQTFRTYICTKYHLKETHRLHWMGG